MISIALGYNIDLVLFLAYNKHNQKEIFLGNFDTLEEATKIRKEAEKKYFKEYRRLN